jgi:hypothetical protein
MYLTLSAITGLELVFVTCAVIGGGFFILRVALMCLGFGHHDVGGAGHIGSGTADFHTGGTDVHHGSDSADSDISFKFLSLQGITAFFMMFGLVGWAMLRQSKQSEFMSILAAVAAGAATVWLINKIFRWASTMQFSGTLTLENAVGCEGTVYLTIKAGQTGKVQLTIQGGLTELDARSESSEDIKTGQPVRVVKVINNMLIVQAI